MSGRARIDSRRAKRHRSYTVAEAAGLFGVHRNTVRYWLKGGLPHFKIGRETVVLGVELSAFLRRRTEARRCACPPGTIYCLRCRTARAPVAGSVSIVHRGPAANLAGACSMCGGALNRRVNPLRLREAGFDLTDSPNPSLNCHPEGA